MFHSQMTKNWHLGFCKSGIKNYSDPQGAFLTHHLRRMSWVVQKRNAPEGIRVHRTYRPVA